MKVITILVVIVATLLIGTILGNLELWILAFLLRIPAIQNSVFASAIGLAVLWLPLMAIINSFVVMWKRMWLPWPPHLLLVALSVLALEVLILIIYVAIPG